MYLWLCWLYNMFLTLLLWLMLAPSFSSLSTISGCPASAAIIRARERAFCMKWYICMWREGDQHVGTPSSCSCIHAYSSKLSNFHIFTTSYMYMYALKCTASSLVCRIVYCIKHILGKLFPTMLVSVFLSMVSTTSVWPSWLATCSGVASPCRTNKIILHICPHNYVA